MASEAQFPRLVDHATEPPGKCAITGDSDGPFVDTGLYADDPAGLKDLDNLGVRYRVYLSVPYLKYNIGRDLLGLVDASEHAEEKAAMEDELEALQIAFDALHKAGVAA